MLAVIETGGKQYLVKKGDTIKVEKLDVEVGSKINFDKVLLITDEEGKDTKIGKPYLEGVTVSGKVEDQARDRKIRVVKYKRKIRYRKIFGHRQHFTKIIIEEVK